MSDSIETLVTDADFTNPSPFNREHLFGTMIASGVDEETASLTTRRIAEALELANINRVTRDDLRDLMSIALRESRGFIPSSDFAALVRRIRDKSNVADAALERGSPTLPRAISQPLRVELPETFAERTLTSVDRPTLSTSRPVPVVRTPAAVPPLSSEFSGELPAVELRLELDGNPRVMLDAFIRPEQEGTILYLYDTSVPMQAVSAIVPEVGFNQYEFDLGLYGLAPGATYGVAGCLVGGSIVPGPNLYLPPFFSPAPFSTVFSSSEPPNPENAVLQRISELMKLINKLIKMREDVLKNAPYGTLLIYLKKTYGIISKIPASVWFAAAFFALCNDRVVGQLARGDLKKLLRLLLFFLDLERQLIKGKSANERSTKEKAQLVALDGAIKALEELLDRFDTIVSDKDAQKAVIQVKAFINERFADAFELLKASIGTLAWLPILTGPALWAGAHFAACNNAYLGRLTNEQLYQILVMFDQILRDAIASLEGQKSLTAAQKAELAALKKAAERTGKEIDQWNNAAAANAARKLLDEVKAFIKANAPLALARLAQRLKEFALESPSNIKMPRFFYTTLIQYILKKRLSKEAAKRVWGPVALVLALIDLGQLALVVDDALEIDKMIRRARWFLANELLKLGALNWPDNNIGRHQLQISAVTCKRIRKVVISANVVCGEVSGDDFKYEECPLKLLDGDKEVNEIKRDAKDLDKDAKGKCGLSYRVKLDAPCIKPNRVCWVVLDIEITWDDGSSTNQQMIIQAKKT